MTDAKKYASWKPTQAQGHVGKLSSTQYWRTTSIWNAGRFLFNATSLRVFLDDIFDGSDGCIRPWSCGRLVTSMCSAWIKRGRSTAAMISIQQTIFSCKQAGSGSGYLPWRGKLLQIARCWNGNDHPFVWLCGLHQQPSTKSKHKHQQLHN